MGEMYLGTILLWSLPTLPNDYAYCNGQIMAIQSNTALFSILGNRFGGNGVTTFALPDFTSRIPIGASTTSSRPNNLTQANLGATGGTENTQLITHSHVAQVLNIPLQGIVGATMSVSSLPANETYPILGSSIAAPMSNLASTCIPALGFNEVKPDTEINGLEIGNPYVATSGQITISSTGSGTKGNYANLQPFLGLNYIICTSGLYPPIANPK